MLGPTMIAWLLAGGPCVVTIIPSAFVMVGHWGLTYNVTPKQGLPFSATIVDRANG